MTRCGPKTRKLASGVERRDAVTYAPAVPWTATTIVSSDSGCTTRLHPEAPEPSPAGERIWLPLGITEPPLTGCEPSAAPLSTRRGARLPGTTATAKRCTARVELPCAGSNAFGP